MTVCSGPTAQDHTLWYEIGFFPKGAEFSIVNHLGVGNEEQGGRPQREELKISVPLPVSCESWIELKGSSGGLWWREAASAAQRHDSGPGHSWGSCPPLSLWSPPSITLLHGIKGWLYAHTWEKGVQARAGTDRGITSQ